jgi:Ca2+-binding RTX toxin-like protein
VTSHGTSAGDLAGVGTDTFTGANAVRGPGFGNFIFDNANSNTLDGQAGNDMIQGGRGADTLIGGLEQTASSQRSFRPYCRKF